MDLEPHHPFSGKGKDLIEPLEAKTPHLQTLGLIFPNQTVSHQEINWGPITVAAQIIC